MEIRVPSPAGLVQVVDQARSATLDHPIHRYWEGRA
jgi:hypothetical protein